MKTIMVKDLSSGEEKIYVHDWRSSLERLFNSEGLTSIQPAPPEAEPSDEDTPDWTNFDEEEERERGDEY